MASDYRFKFPCIANFRSVLGSIGLLSTFFFGSLYLYHSLFIRNPRSFNGQYYTENAKRNINITNVHKENVQLTFEYTKIHKNQPVLTGLSKNDRLNELPLTRMKDSEAIKNVTNKNLAPVCINILQNITQGRWVKRIELLPENEKTKEMLKLKEAKLEKEVADFWVKREIQMSFWRPDKKCGYDNYAQAPANSTWPQVGSWCDAKSATPCCSNVKNGRCVPASAPNCKCLTCVDLRKYLYADVSDWIVTDARCRWRNYSASEACDVIESSPFNDLYFIGDSFMRNMFRTFLMLVTGDPVRGAWTTSMTTEIRQKCSEMQQFFWKECRQNVVDMSELVFANSLCGGRGEAKFRAVMKPFYSKKYSDDFLNLSAQLIGKPGTVIILSIGFHMQCYSHIAINQYLGPVVDEIEKFYGGPPNSTELENLTPSRWPHIILALPLTIGLLKPTAFLKLQNEIKCGIYSARIKEYARKHGITILDFRPLTSMVHSFDGTHHGINVNLMKNQILLNFIASLNIPSKN